MHQRNNLHSSSEKENPPLDSKIIAHVKQNLEQFSDSCTLKKLGLIYIAHRSPKERVRHLRRLYSDFDGSQDGMMTFEDFKAAIAHLNYTEDEISKIFKSAVSWRICLWTSQRCILSDDCSTMIPCSVPPLPLNVDSCRCRIWTIVVLLIILFSLPHPLKCKVW